ncbi:hypothetical protein L2E82_06033 [Cichorium intybus]|uniref:Uncharacterized protein n=1 Tax=Cichorium intybus TaxID=13427 RepID=A0ACB9HB42_CICIN|nr:hypothetical protein L2E82_06033 [Cichorium intybus]
MGPTGDSPLCASASDLDTWNYKAKCVNTPQVAENHVVAATHKPIFTLNFLLKKNEEVVKCKIALNFCKDEIGNITK